MLGRRSRHRGHLADFVEGELTGGECRFDPGQRIQSLAHPQQLAAGVLVEAGVDGQPVWKRPDAGIAPAADLVELRAGFGDLCHRRVDVSRALTNLVLECLGKLLILESDATTSHTENYTKQTFVQRP